MFGFSSSATPAPVRLVSASTSDVKLGSSVEKIETEQAVSCDHSKSLRDPPTLSIIRDHVPSFNEPSDFEPSLALSL